MPRGRYVTRQTRKKEIAFPQLLPDLGKEGEWFLERIRTCPENASTCLLSLYNEIDALSLGLSLRIISIEITR